jgi:hypothetical protein
MNWVYSALRVRYDRYRWRRWFWLLCLVVFDGAADDADDARTSSESGAFPSCRQHDDRNQPAGDRFSDDRATKTRSLIHGLTFDGPAERHRSLSWVARGLVGRGPAEPGAIQPELRRRRKD